MARKKSETRISFEKKFASERRKRIKAGKPGDGGVFTFRGKKYTTDHAKKADDLYINPTASPTGKYGGKKRKMTKYEKKSRTKGKYTFSGKPKWGGDKKQTGGLTEEQPTYEKAIRGWKKAAVTGAKKVKKKIKNVRKKISAKKGPYQTGGMYQDNTVAGAGQGQGATANIVYQESDPAILQQKQAAQDEETKRLQEEASAQEQEIKEDKERSQADIEQAAAQEEAKWQTGAQAGETISKGLKETKWAKKFKKGTGADKLGPIAAARAGYKAVRGAKKTMQMVESFNKSKQAMDALKFSADVKKYGFGMADAMRGGEQAIRSAQATMGNIKSSVDLLKQGKGAFALGKQSSGLLNVSGTTGGYTSPLLGGGAKTTGFGLKSGKDLMGFGIDKATGQMVASEGTKQLAQQSAIKAGAKGFGTGLKNFATSGAGLGLIASGVGMGVSALSDDKDPTKSNVGEYSGAVLQGAGTGASIGSIIPGVGTAVGAVIGGLYGAGKQFFGTRKAKKAKAKFQRERKKKIDKFNKEVTKRFASSRASTRAAELKGKTYSGYDLGRNISYRTGGRMEPVFY